MSLPLSAGLTVNSTTIGNISGAEGFRSSWINDNFGLSTTAATSRAFIREDFEDIGLGGPGNKEVGYTSLSTNVGTFAPGAGAQPGLGEASVSTTTPKIVVKNFSEFGRYNTTAGGKQFLDSGDVTKVRLDLTPPLNNFFFFFMDPNDTGNKQLTIRSNLTTYSYDLNTSEQNGDLFFFGWKGAAGETLSFIEWTNVSGNPQRDGWAFDDLGYVPEPGYYGAGALLAAGMFLALQRRKKANA